MCSATWHQLSTRSAIGSFPEPGASGPRILNFAPLVVMEQFPINRLIQALLKAAENALGANVEIEFAVTIHETRGQPPRARLGFLQVRPMVVSEDVVEVSASDLSDPRAILASDMVMGNGVAEDIQDIVFVRPENFSPMQTPAIAQQLEAINRQLSDEQRPFLLIGFGRWGSSHPSLGIPVVWSQISGARAIVEATLPEMNVELSQGSHFFHNLSSFRTCYFMVRHDGPHSHRLGLAEPPAGRAGDRVGAPRPTGRNADGSRGRPLAAGSGLGVQYPCK